MPPATSFDVLKVPRFFWGPLLCPVDCEQEITGFGGHDGSLSWGRGLRIRYERLKYSRNGGGVNLEAPPNSPVPVG